MEKQTLYDFLRELVDDGKGDEIYKLLDFNESMILWDELEEIKEKSIENEQSLEIQLLINNLKITSFIEYNAFIYTMSLDILELDHNEYIIEDKTIENKQVKSPIKYIQVTVKKDS